MPFVAKLRMIKPRILVSILCLTLLMTTVSCTSGQSDSGTIEPAPTELTMLSIAEGQVLVMKAGTDSWTEASAGTTVELGDTLKAGDDSRAEITFFEGSTIELEAGTEVEVVELGIAEETGSTIIRLKQTIGNTVSRVNKLADANSTYEVETPTAIAAVRGSIMFVRVHDDGATTVGNGEGSVSVSAQGEEVVLPEGTHSNVEQGQPPSAPQPGTGTSSISITKTAEPSMVHNGDTVTYTYLVTNSGGMPLSGISITDDKTGSTEVDENNVLDVGETWEFSATYTVSTTDSDPLVNTATASGMDTEGQVVTAQATASVSILRPSIALAKIADPIQAGKDDTIVYTYTVTNTGNTPLSGITVVDGKLGDTTYQSGDIDSNGELDVGESWVYTATYTVGSENEGSLVNVAIASAHDTLGQAVTAQAAASVALLQPAIALTKTAEPAEAQDGDVITYTYTVTNTGNTPLFGVTVTDDMLGAVTYQSGDSDGDGELDVGESWVYTATYTVGSEDEGSIVNVAIASGSDTSGRIVTAEASTSVEISAEEPEPPEIIVPEPPALIVNITSPQDGATITTHTITVTGTISDPSITQATIDINGNPHAIAVSNGSFSTDENLLSGLNTITVTATNAQQQTASDTVTVDAQITTFGIRIELSWSTAGTDVDLHLVRPGGYYGTIPDDCYWANPNPDWGIAEVTEDNPSLDQDDVNGYGPENITLEQPEDTGEDMYLVIIHYFDDYGLGPSNVTVKIWIDDELVAIYGTEDDPIILDDDDVWYCATISWPSGEVFPGGGPLSTKQDSSATSSYEVAEQRKLRCLW